MRECTRCDGVGMRIRDIFRQRPPADHPRGPFINLARCGADDMDIKERECDTCGAMTCDECRVHLVYQDTRASNHWWDALWGYVLLDPKLRNCWTAVDEQGDFPWDDGETHNDLGYGAPTVSEVDMALAQFDHLDEIFEPAAWRHLDWGREHIISPHGSITYLMEDNLRPQMPLPRGYSYKLDDPDEIFYCIVYEPFNQAAGARKRFL
jgi:hypothetical protein